MRDVIVLIFVSALSLSFGSVRFVSTFAGGTIDESSANSKTRAILRVIPITGDEEYKNDVNRLFAMRSKSLDELIALGHKMEAKWRQVDWNRYADIMKYVCSEIARRDSKDGRVRQSSEDFAKVALSHSNMYLWEHESALVEYLGYKRSLSGVNSWRTERRVKAQLWLHAWQRLENQSDPTFDVNDRTKLPLLRVAPPAETGLPAGVSPSAIKDRRLRAKYEAAIAENDLKSERVSQQLPLRLHGPAFKTRVERWLIQAYSQAPRSDAELMRYLKMYIADYSTRERILREVRKNPQ